MYFKGGDISMTFTKKKINKHIFTTIVMIIVLCTMVTATVFAKTISDFTWLQGTGEKRFTLDR